MIAELKKLARPVYRRIRHIVQRWSHRPLSLTEAHRYWRNPGDDANSPELYLKDHELRSIFLVELVRRYAEPDTSILEIGCNVGRNLNYLFDGGFPRLSGIEINTEAVALLRQNYPKLAQTATIYNDAVENLIREFADAQFDVIFTMAVLEHIHRDSEWVFNEIPRICGSWLITIENEVGISPRHFPRNYQKVFGRLGMRQVEAIGDLAEIGLGTGFICRVFQK